MTRPADTTLEAWNVELGILRAMSGAERVAMAFEMSESTRAVAEAGIRHRHPDWTDQQVHDELLVVLLGRELAERVKRAKPIPA
jgi:hypothetical protein